MIFTSRASVKWHRNRAFGLRTLANAWTLPRKLWDFQTANTITKGAHRAA